ncbi:uncharacterized protein LOC144155790 isoform X3 [Haemaphysalis longicornis]
MRFFVVVVARGYGYSLGTRHTRLASCGAAMRLASISHVRGRRVTPDEKQPACLRAYWYTSLSARIPVVLIQVVVILALTAHEGCTKRWAFVGKHSRRR